MTYSCCDLLPRSGPDDLTCLKLHHKIKDAGCRTGCTLAAPSFNGRTADSGSAYRGSNPWGAAKQPLPPLYFPQPLKFPLLIPCSAFASCLHLLPPLFWKHCPACRSKPHFRPESDG